MYSQIQYNQFDLQINIFTWEIIASDKFTFQLSQKLILKLLNSTNIHCIKRNYSQLFYIEEMYV